MIVMRCPRSNSVSKAFFHPGRRLFAMPVSIDFAGENPMFAAQYSGARLVPDFSPYARTESQDEELVFSKDLI